MTDLSALAEKVEGLERCPVCRLSWRVCAPAKIDGADKVRCVECKSVFPAALLRAKGGEHGDA